MEEDSTFYCLPLKSSVLFNFVRVFLFEDYSIHLPRMVFQLCKAINVFANSRARKDSERREEGINFAEKGSFHFSTGICTLHVDNFSEAILRT